LTAPYTPEKNGVVEWRNQTIMGKAHSMLKAMVMPGWFWGEAVATIVYMLNRSPTQRVDGRIHYEVWHDIKPKVHHCTRAARKQATHKPGGLEHTNGVCRV
jgi:hypothetical protein